MKKILLIVLCLGFAMTQSIQTKQVEVTITDLSDINLYELIENPIEGNYAFELIGATLNSGDVISSGGRISLLPVDDENYTEFTMMSDRISLMAFSESSDYIYVLSSRKKMVNQYPVTNMVQWDMMDNPLTENFEISLTFWVTGMFEDEVGLQGDMNDDEMINVIDIIALVNIIIDVEE